MIALLWLPLLFSLLTIKWRSLCPFLQLVRWRSLEVAVLATELTDPSVEGITEWWLVTSCRLEWAICVSTPWNVLLFSSPIWFVSAQFTWSFSHNKQVVKLGILHFPAQCKFFFLSTSWQSGPQPRLRISNLWRSCKWNVYILKYLQVPSTFGEWECLTYDETGAAGCLKLLWLRKMRRCAWDACHQEGLEQTAR